MPTTPEPPASKSGLIGRGKWAVKIIAGILAVVAAGGWITLGVALFLVKLPQQVTIVAIFGAALATEGLIWTIAALLGLSVFEARKRIWHRLTGRNSPDNS